MEDTMNHVLVVSTFVVFLAASAACQTANGKVPDETRNSTTVDVAQAGEGNIVGTVVDAQYRSPLEGATVEVLGTDKTGTTGKDGQYRISSLAKGFYQVRAGLIPAYNFVTINNVAVQPGREEPLFFELKRVSDEPPDFVPVEKQPAPISTPAPKYPESARRDSLEGVIWVKLLVDEKGNAVKAHLLRLQCTRPGLTVEAAVVDSLKRDFIPEQTYEDIKELVATTTDTAMQWKFSPALLGGKPVKVWVSIPFKYKLQPPEKKETTREKSRKLPK